MTDGDKPDEERIGIHWPKGQRIVWPDPEVGHRIEPLDVSDGDGERG